jgi:hypothetical protein
LTAAHARSFIEQFVAPGILAGGVKQFLPKSFSSDFCTSLVHSDQFKAELPQICRILTVPLPFLVNGRLIYPAKGYDSRFGTYLVEDAPEIVEGMPLDEAVEMIRWLYREFCFTSEQSRVHAFARLITPFARCILGWTARTPLWHYCANRPRSGKDYAAGVPLIVYEGQAFEDFPIGRIQEETSKRLVAAARSGRRFMHFSNCEVYLCDQYLTQAITNPVIRARSLGTNDGSSDLELPNEMEYSFSSQVGLTCSEDVAARMRPIELAFSDEDPNKRVFETPNLHEKVKEMRPEILSALAALYRNWEEKGCPKGPTPFTSFPRWAQVVGGVMTQADLGDPCLPFAGSTRMSEAT